MKQNGIIFDIKKYSLHDGPGIRTTVFLKGCPLSCWWCHNPESQQLQPTELCSPGFKRDFYTTDDSESYSLGREMSLSDVIEEIEKDVLFYDESAGGVTFSGGEPLSQSEYLFELIRTCRNREIHTIIDTCGYADSSVITEAGSLTDLFYFDLKLIDNMEHKKYTGVSNDIILKNLQLLTEANCQVHIRIPIVHGITDTQKNIEDISTFLLKLRQNPDISLLPYNQFGNQKYTRLKIDNHLPNLAPPSSKKMKQVAEFFSKKGFNTHIGG